MLVLCMCLKYVLRLRQNSPDYWRKHCSSLKRYETQIEACPWVLVFTAPKRSLRRLCFYTCLSFCPRRGCAGGGVHGGGHAWWGACVAGRACMAGCMHGRGACMAGGVCVAGGCAWQGGGMCGGAPLVDTMAKACGQWAGSTHPTVMHSCLI